MVPVLLVTLSYAVAFAYILADSYSQVCIHIKDLHTYTYTLCVPTRTSIHIHLRTNSAIHAS